MSRSRVWGIAGGLAARHLSAIACLVATAATVVPARAAAPTLQIASPDDFRVSQVTLGLQSNTTGTGYFTLLEGVTPKPGSAAQTKAGLDGNGVVAARRGSLSLTAGTIGRYTVTNLKANTDYTLCFTADDGAVLAAGIMSATFKTGPLSLIERNWNPVRWSETLPSSTSASLAITTQGDVAVAHVQPDGAAVTTFGPGGFPTYKSISAGAVEQIKMAVAPDNIWYVGYSDLTAGKKAVVKKYTYSIDGSTAWKAVGDAVSTGAVENFSLAVAPDGTPYAAFLEGGSIKVMKFSGSSWTAADDESPWSGTADQLSFAISHQGEPFIAFRDTTKAADQHPAVRKLSSGAWTNVGGDRVDVTDCSTLQLGFAPDGTPHVIFYGVDHKTRLMKYESSFDLWASVGDQVPARGTRLTLAFAPDGTPFVAAVESTDMEETVVIYYISGHWSSRHPLSVSTGHAFSLAFGSDGTPYITFIDGGEGDAGNGKVKLMAYEPNHAPVISGTLAGQTVNDNATIRPFSGVTITDVDAAQELSVGVQLDDWTKGTFDDLGGFSESGSGYYTYTGTALDATALIRGMVFKPRENHLLLGKTETTTFTVSVADNIADGVVDSTTTVISTSVNDAPTLSSDPVDLGATDEDAPWSGSRVSDVATNADDQESGVDVGIAITATSGRGIWQYSSDGDTWTSFPALSENAALLLSPTSRIRYVPDKLNGETVTLTFRAWDQTTGTASDYNTARTAIVTANGGTTAFSSTSATASLVVAPVNDAPVATNDAFTVAEDSAATVFAVRANDTDVDAGAVLTVTAVTQPATGATVTLGGGGVSFTPTPNFFGTSVFTYTITDDQGGSATATITVTVTPVNDLPTAANDTYSVGANSAATVLNVLANDTSLPDAPETLAITAVTQPADGAVTFTSDSVSFTPALDFSGSTSFTYTITDGNGGYATGTVTVTVRPENRAPTAIALSPGSVVRSAGVNAPVGTLSTTDADTDDTFTYTLVGGIGDTHNSQFNLSLSGTTTTLRANDTRTMVGGTYSVRLRSTDAGSLSCEQALTVEVLNDVLTVTSNADSGPNTLRQAITDIATGGVISFALTSGQETITVESELLISESLTIDGRNTAGSGKPVTVQVHTPGSSQWRVMKIDMGKGLAVTLQSLVLKGGDVRANLYPDNVGGVVLSQADRLDLVDVTMTDGVAKAGGGLGVLEHARAIRCTFSGNRAIGTGSDATGGGVANLNGSLILMNCTVAGNTSHADKDLSRGGGVYSDGTTSIINSTITGNSVSGTAASQEGGGVYNEAVMQVVNSILVGNQAESGADIAQAAAGLTFCGYSWFDGVGGPPPIEVSDAPNQRAPYAPGQLAALGNYGGVTQTVRVSPDAPAVGHATRVYADNDNYWFLANDGQYHRIDDGVIEAPTGIQITTDQRGVVRTSSPTIGAYQLGAGVTGTITRAGGGPLSGVTVNGGGRSATTGANGSFALSDLLPGTHTITPSYPGYAFTPSTRSVTVASADVSGVDFVAAPVPVDPPPSKQSQTITFPPLADVTLGQTVNLTASASSGLSVTLTVKSGPASVSGRTLTTTGVGLVTVRATQSGNSSYEAATPVERSFMVTAGLPPAPVVPPAIGGGATLMVPGSNSGLAYQWLRNGQALPGATGATLTLNNVQPPTAGLYAYTVQTPGGGTGTSEPVIVGLSTKEKVVGTGEQVGADIRHPNGNIYDQLLLEGSGASLSADPGQITRMSFVDLSNDIVQVEFSGAGTLSLVMDGAPVPAVAANYNQPGVSYVRGNVGIVITGANEMSNVSVFSVGRITAVNQALFRDGVAYDGVANIAFIAIQSANGKFGGVYTGNVEYFASQGFTGLYAPGVQFAGPVNIGDIQAFDDAQPLLVVGSASNVRIAGGNLAQPNGQPVTVNGLTQLTMAPGQTSQGDTLPAQANQGVLEQDRVDVTDLLVVNP